MSADQYATIDRLLDQFAESFRDGELPRIEAYLPRVSPQGRQSLLEELLLMELELRRAAEEVPDEQEYLRRFPAEAELVARAFTQSLAMSQSPVPGGGPERPLLESQGVGSRVLQTVSLPEFTRQVTELGAISEEAWQALRRTSDDSARSLARALVEAGVLTRFQAELMLRGEGSRLRVGNYLLEEPLGAGGMGQVYRGRHLRLKQPVAIKVLSAELSGNKLAIKRFKREVRLASKVNHPNVVTALDAEELEGRLYLVMEYVPGQDLSKRVRQQGPAPVAEAVDWICQATLGLESAHRQGILHRDIKPGNLLLTDSGQVKVLDLGLATSHAGESTAVNLDKTATQLTSTGMGLGTVDFMSPEQAADARVVDERSDLYSLGCTLYFLLTGKPPYGGATMIQRIVAHSSEAIPSLQETRDDIPQALDRVVTRLLAKRPEQRYGSCGELLQDLRRLQAVGLPQEVPGRIRRPTRRPVLTPAPAAAEQSPPEWAQLAVDSTPVVAGRAPSSADGELRGQRRWLAGLLGAIALVGMVAGLGLWARGGTPPATLTVSVKPESAVVELMNPQGQVVAREAARGGQATLQAPPGGYRLKVSLDEFERAERDVLLVDNERKSVEVVLEPSPERKVLQTGSDHPTLWFLAEPAQFEDWLFELQKQSRERQIAMIQAKLKELNPDLVTTPWEKDLKTHKQLVIRSEGLRDISPLCALKGSPSLADVQDVVFEKRSDLPSFLTDLSPLERLQITQLAIPSIPVSDLEPLKGMRLSSLNIDHTEVRDLGPLASCKRLQQLSANDTKVQFLDPLQQLQLVDLSMNGAKILEDLRPLEKMQSLRVLSLAHCTNLKSLDPLRGIALESLNVSRTAIDTLADLKLDRLHNLEVEGLLNLTEINVLQGARNLETLKLLATNIRDLGPLRDLPRLRHLTLTMDGDSADQLRAQVDQLRHLQTLNGQPFTPKSTE